MRWALTIKNKLRFINGKILKPSTTADPLYAPWERCNNMVIAWIQQLVNFEHQSSIAHAETAASLWNDLCERFSIQNAPRIFQLTKSISSLTQDDDSVSQYYNKLKSFWDELEIYEPIPSCTCGAVKTLMDYTHRSKVMQFLMGLNDSYDSIRAQILLNDLLLALNRVLSLVQQKERHRQLHSSPAPIAMAAKGPDQCSPSAYHRDRLFYSHCNISRHSLEQCFKANPNLPVCSHCRIPRHTKESATSSMDFLPGTKVMPNINHDLPAVHLSEDHPGLEHVHEDAVSSVPCCVRGWCC
ncbi:uncharacterized protein LOC121235357 [Juglans microcarpa x Juglans regia]|uniref:uncharacterized protein LOC121235357 n=1 Tax=Juglans microcarpa x Juglans regia TaxID=2249226 RepID=UPI001B7F0D0B|nr:uncharacterized protein LOC121235357 [Juglans microcarpa x Juglans regia]